MATAWADAPLITCEVSFTPYDALTPWTDVTPYLRLDQGVRWGRGREGIVQETQPGECQVVLDNAAGYFTKGGPAQAAGLAIGNALRLRAVHSTTKNRCLNPTVEASIDGWGGSSVFWPTGSTVAQDAAQAQQGTKSVKVTWPTATAANTGAQYGLGPQRGGAQVTVSAYVYVVSGPNVTLTVWDGAVLRTGTTSSGTGSWQRLSVTFTPDKYGTAFLLMRPATNPTTGQVCHVDSVQVEQAAAPTAFEPVGAYTQDLFNGTVLSWPTAWPGGVSTHSLVTVRAVDQQRKMAEVGALPSLLQAEVLYDGPEAYYPLTEPGGALAVSDPTDAARPQLWVDSYSVGSDGTWEFGAAGGPAGTCLRLDPISQDNGWLLSNRETLGQLVPGAWLGYGWRAFEVWVRTDPGWLPDPTAYAMVMRPVTGSSQFAVGVNSAGQVIVEGLDGTGAPYLYLAAPTGFVNDGAWHHLAVRTNYDFADTTVYLYIDGVLAGTSSWAGAMDSVGVLDLGGSGAWGGMWQGWLAHAAYFNEPDTTAARLAEHYDAGLATLTERTDERVARLLRLAGVPAASMNLDTGLSLTVNADVAGKTPLDGIRACEVTEDGIYYIAGDGRHTFQSRSRRLNPAAAFTLTFADLADEPLLVYDDRDTQAVGNDITVTAGDGTSRRVIGDLSPGRYGKTLQTLHPDLDTAVDLARWRQALWGVPQPRIDRVAFNLLGLPSSTWDDLLAIDVSTVFALSGPPSQATGAPLTFIVEGYDWEVTPQGMTVTLRVSTAEGHNVWQIGRAGYSEVGTTTRLGY